jgi:hypothetical protein
MTRWLDFSGAPPLLIPSRLVSLWRGTTNPATGEYSELNMDDPVTDYDRACVKAWPGRGVLPIGDASALVLYTEFDDHTWHAPQMLVACGGWLPTQAELQRASWQDPLRWQVRDAEFMLVNSAADAAGGLQDHEFIEVYLAPGEYFIEYTRLESTYLGCFHRLTLAAHEQSAA